MFIIFAIVYVLIFSYLCLISYNKNKFYESLCNRSFCFLLFHFSPQVYAGCRFSFVFESNIFLSMVYFSGPNLNVFCMCVTFLISFTIYIKNFIHCVIYFTGTPIFITFGIYIFLNNLFLVDPIIYISIVILQRNISISIFVFPTFKGLLCFFYCFI